MAIKRSVVKGDLKQVKGSGASGSFKLGEKKAAAPKAKKVSKFLHTSLLSQIFESFPHFSDSFLIFIIFQPVAKKPASEKKAKSAKKPAAKKPKAEKKAKSPKKAMAPKAKSAKKSPKKAAKPKSTKPKVSKPKAAKKAPVKA